MNQQGQPVQTGHVCASGKAQGKLALIPLEP